MKTLEEEKQEKETQYYKFIDTCAKKEKYYKIYNLVDDRISYVLKIIFRYATKEVYIFGRRFDIEVFSGWNLISEAVNFLQKPNSVLKIAYRDPMDMNDFQKGEFLRGVLNLPIKGEVEIFDASKITNINDISFFVNDLHWYRMRSSDGECVANFGNKWVGGFYADLFINNIVKQSCRVY